MVGFHHPRDPYFPNQGNNRWLEESEEQPEEEPEEDPEEETEGEPEAEAEGRPAEPVVDQEAEDAEGSLEEEPNDNEEEYHKTSTLKSSTCISYLHSREGNTTELHPEDPYYPTMIANEWSEGEPEEVQRENPKLGLEEYQERNLEGKDSDEESDMDEGAKEILSEPYPLGSNTEPTRRKRRPYQSSPPLLKRR
ncbi:uncharacterized protein LOC122197536 [Lactuca sativa]|uniref:uncharacterized protein LOC122197536 n=1 Tax=Lactuca sativa TaxID=4236 RepID=UPI001C68C5E2|nr:uncharacterized protein LOC122197536 [Lactuca sativa]